MGQKVIRLEPMTSIKLSSSSGYICDMVNKRMIWESFYGVAKHIVKNYVGDLYHDAFTLQSLSLQPGLTWYYCVGDNGTRLIFDLNGLREDELLEEMKYMGNLHIFRCEVTLEPSGIMWYLMGKLVKE